MSRGTMKYTLKAHVCYFVLMVWLIHDLYSLHPDFYTLENIINIEIYNGQLFYQRTRNYEINCQSSYISYIKGALSDKIVIFCYP
jgi:hypothetical protein